MDLLALSQREFGHIILQDITLICVIGVILAGLIHGWLRQASPSQQWNQIGKVSTVGLGPADIAGCLLVTSIYWIPIILPYQDTSSNEITTSGVIQMQAIFAFMAGAVFLIYHQRSLLPEALGLRPKRPALVLLWATLGFILIRVIFMGLQELELEKWLSDRLGEPELQRIVSELMSTQNNQKRVTMIIAACVFAPIIEEVIFRGYLYPVIKRYTEPVIAAIFTGVIFGAIHGQIWAVIPLSIFGILLALLYEKSGSIWTCILCHAMFNSFNVYCMLTIGDQL